MNVLSPIVDCHCAGSTTSLFSNESFEVVRKIKSWEDCRNNIAIQLNFGKISEWYLTKLKGKLIP